MSDSANDIQPREDAGVSTPESPAAPTSAEQRRAAEIEAAIDEALASSGLDVEEAMAKFAPERRGIALPLFFNAGLLVIGALAIGLLFLLFTDRQEQAVASRSTAETVESQILAQTRRDAERELVGKDQEIADIQSRVASIQADRERILAQQDQTLALREEQLRAELDTALETERQRLAQEGLSAQAQADALARFSERRNAQLEEELALARDLSDQQAAASAAELDQLQAQYLADLETAQTASDDLRRQLDEQAEASAAELAAQLQELEQARSDAEQQFQSAQELGEQRSLVLSQITAAYDRTSRLYRLEDWDGALQALQPVADLAVSEAYLTTVSDASRRSAAELFVVSAIRDAIVARQGGQGVEVAPVPEADASDEQNPDALTSLIAEVQTALEPMESAVARLDLDAASAAFVAALALVPELLDAQQSIQGLEDSQRDRQRALATVAIADAQRANQSGNQLAAIERYTDALLALTLPGEPTGQTSADGVLQSATRLESSVTESSQLTDLLANERSSRRLAEIERDQLRQSLALSQAEADAADAAVGRAEAEIATLEQSGAQAQAAFDVEPGEHLQISVLFDPERAVVEHGNGSYHLKPVIRYEVS